MNLKSKKFLVFLINAIVLAASLWGVIVLLEGDNGDLIKWILASFIANGVSYTTGNVVINNQKSKNYHPEMDK